MNMPGMTEPIRSDAGAAASLRGQDVARVHRMEARSGTWAQDVAEGSGQGILDRITPASSALSRAGAVADAPCAGPDGSLSRAVEALMDRAAAPHLGIHAYRSVLEELHSLRVGRAALPETAPECRTLLDAATRVALFTPLTEAASASGQGASVDTLADGCARLVGARTRPQLEQAAAELDALARTWGAGMGLGGEQREKTALALDLVRRHVDAKREVLRGLEQSDAQLARLEKRDGSATVSLPELYARLTDFRAAGMEPGATELPFADLFLASLTEAVNLRLARLDGLSRAARKHLLAEAAALAARHAPGPPGPDAARSVQALTASLQRTADLLRPTDRAFLARALSGMFPVAPGESGVSAAGRPAAVAEMEPALLPVLKELLRKSGDNPLLTVGLDRLIHTDRAAAHELLRALRAAWAPQAETEAGVRAVERLEALVLDQPLLDGLSLELEKSCLPESAHGHLLRDHGVARAKRELGRLFPERGGGPVDDAFLDAAVAALAGGKGQDVDLQVLRVFWHVRAASAESPDFDAFQKSLPEPYSTLEPELLRALLDSDMRGLADAHAVAGALADASRGLSKSSRARQIFQMITRGADRFRAEQISTILARNLLDARSLTGAQALEVGGALREALDKALREAPSAGERAVDKLRALGRKEAVLSGDYEQQLEAVLARIPEVRDGVRALLDREAVLGAADELLADHMLEHARNLRGVTQKGGLVPVPAPDAPPLVVPERLRGEQLSVGLLALDDILQNRGGVYGTTWREQQAALSQLSFQQLFRLDEMRGTRFGEGADEASARLKMAFEGLQRAVSEQEFGSHRRTLRELFEQHALLPKSEAILFFKSRHDRSGADTLNRALTQKHRFAPDSLGARRMRQKYATLRGSGARAAQALTQSEAERTRGRKQMDRLIDAPLTSLSTHVARVVNSAVHLAVLETFQAGPHRSFADFLREVAENRADTEAVRRSPLFAASLETLTGKLGLPPDLAEMGLLSFFRRAGNNVLERLAGETTHNFLLALRRFADGRAVHAEVRSLMAGEEAREAALELMAGLESGQSVAMNLETGVLVSVPLATVGGLDVRLLLGGARENGLCAWRDGDGQPHLTVCEGFSGHLGASVNGLLGTMAAKAGVTVKQMEAGELTFASDDAFAAFMGELFSGRASLETLRYCSDVAYRSSATHSGEAVLTTVDMTDFFGFTLAVAEFSFESRAALAKTWTETVQGDTRTISDTTRYDLGLSAQLGLLGKDYAQMAVQPVADFVAQKAQLSDEARDRARNMLEKPGVRADFSVTVTKTSSKSYAHGQLSGAQTTRNVHLVTGNPRSEADAILARFHLDDGLRDAVRGGIESLHAQGAHCALKAVWTLEEKALQAWRAASSRQERERLLQNPAHYRISEVVVQGTWKAVENNTALSGLGQAFRRNASGTLGRDLVFTPEAPVTRL